jgi:hypothetical protein
MTRTRVALFGRWAVTLSLFVVPVAARQGSPMPDGTSSISGHVLAGDTDKPIRGAVVEIVIYGNLSGRFRQVLTDADGKFEFKNLPAGQFQVAAQATRYLRMQFGQLQPGPVGLLNPARMIEIAEGQAFSAADFKLSRFSAIEGVVVDEFGDPAPNVAIQVSQVQFAGGRKRLVPANPSSDAGPTRPTDDRGRFRVAGLAPGDYYVEALSGAFADPNAAGGFAVTFFPGTAKASGATPVSVSPGHDQLNLVFTLVPAPMARVAGTLVDADDHSIGGGNLMLVPSERTGASLFMVVRSSATAGGEFVFRNVPPGTYTIQAFGAPVGNAGNLGAYAFGYRTFTVDGQDLDQLTVKVPAPRTLRGHLTFEGEGTPPKPREIFVSARQIEFESAPVGGGPPPMIVHEDYTFEVSAMSGLRLVSAGAPGAATAAARSAWLTKRVMLNGVDVTDTPVDLREKDVNDVEIVMTTRATTITGSVIGPDQKPVADCNVLIFADDETKWGPWSRYVAFTRQAQQDKFTIRGLPAGSYIAVVTPNLPNGEWQDPEFLQKQRTRIDATRFVLLDAETKMLQLTKR